MKANFCETPSLTILRKQSSIWLYLTKPFLFQKTILEMPLLFHVFWMELNPWPWICSSFELRPWDSDDTGAPSPTLFVWLLFCNSCYYRFWSAVIAGGKIGPDGVLLCMNGALEELGLNRPSLNGVYAPPACLRRAVLTTVAWSGSALVESDGKVESWAGLV